MLEKQIFWDRFLAIAKKTFKRLRKGDFSVRDAPRIDNSLQLNDELLLYELEIVTLWLKNELKTEFQPINNSPSSVTS